MQNIYAVIMAGGSGTRFWPKSTSQRPKQFLDFQRPTAEHSGTSLLKQTIERFKSWIPSENIWVVTTRALEALVAAEDPSVRVLAEPEPRNTAPCIYWAAREVFERDPQGTMLIMPSDHAIGFPTELIRTAQLGAQWAATHNDLVTLGVQPTRAETGFGYLRTSPLPQVSGEFQGTIRKVAAFVEKPDEKTAQEFLSAGHYFWNGGMFIWRAEAILHAFDTFLPAMKAAWEEGQGSVDRAYPLMPAISIDYGIMEKADNVVMLPLACGWDDLGSWTALENLAQNWGLESENNIVLNGQVTNIDSFHNLIDVPTKQVALIGIEDLVIVETDKVLLVARKSRAQDVKKAVEKIKKTRPDLV